MSLEEEKKKLNRDKHRHPLVRVTTNPTSKANKAPDVFRDFLFRPQTAIPIGRTIDIVILTKDIWLTNAEMDVAILLKYAMVYLVRASLVC